MLLHQFQLCKLKIYIFICNSVFIYLQENRMKQDFEAEHSDQEGFFTQKIEIKNSNLTQHRSSSVNSRAHFNKLPFQAKFLPWAGVLKKQPIEAYKVSNNIVNNQVERSQKRKNKNQTQDHPYRLYSINQNYQLVYNRSRQPPIINDKYFMHNEMKLHHIGGKNSEGYKKLKNFDINQNRQARVGGLIFDSKFQCGNLHCVYKNQKSQEYILFIQNDTNSLGYNQWFYFSIQNNQANIKYTFKIVNFKKKHSFFKYGCKPAVFSQHEAKMKGQGWSRKVKNVIYEQSPIYIQQLPAQKFYSLNFDISFEHKDDFILLAMNVPYSYSKMVAFLREAEMLANQDEQNNLQFTIKSISTTVCGNDVPEITISRRSDEEKKKMIIISARQHPGEVWSSYMIQGMIRWLISKPQQDANWLLDHYIFKIYPMINIDGVIYGNFRCDVTGTDLNRRWKDTSKLMHPQVHEIKRKIGLYRSRYKIQCCFDLHGHSKNYNIFCYSCKDNQYTCRILPYLISKTNPIFDFSACTFGISKYKETTARANIYKLVKTENVLTVETSFYGSKLDGTIKQFGPEDIYKMGEDILLATRYFLDKKSKALTVAKMQIQNKINEFLNYDKIHEEDSGSQSDPSGDQIDLQIKINQIFNKDLVDINELKGIKPQRVTKHSPIKIKFQDQLLQIKGKQYKNKKQSSRSNIVVRQVINFKNPSQVQTIQENTVNKIHFGAEFLEATSPKKSKKTISYLQSRQQNQLNESDSQFKNSNPSFRERHKKLSVHTTNQPKSQRSKQFKIPTAIKNSKQLQAPSKIRESLGDQQYSKSIQNVRKSDEFIKKFQRFIPISIAMKNRANMSMFEQSLYNEDQSNLISMLLENKRKIELQKIKRNVQQSTYLVERQGKIKVSNRKQKVVDFRSFKQNEKVNQQIRKLTSINYSRYDQS